MTVTPEIPTYAWIAIGACVALALVLSVIGVLTVLPRARKLQRRVDLYPRLPVVRALAATQLRIAATQARVGEVNALLVRAQVALAQIQAAMAGLLATAAVLSNAFRRTRDAVTWVQRVLGLSTRPLRSRGS